MRYHSIVKFPDKNGSVINIEDGGRKTVVLMDDGSIRTISTIAAERMCVYEESEETVSSSDASSDSLCSRQESETEGESC